MKNKGITLVALVVTIILLLILAGISIATLTGSGLFENAKLAEQKSKNTQELEDSILKEYENKIGEYVDGTREYNNQYELLATFNTINEEKQIPNIKNYKEFEIVIIYDNMYCNSCRYNTSLYSTEYYYMSAYNAGTTRAGGVKFLNETTAKAGAINNITSMKLYGIK